MAAVQGCGYGKTMGRRADSDEAYILDLCDELLGWRAQREHRFPFLLGDPGKSGRRTSLPVDAYYPDLALVIEYQERQHFEAVAHFDKPWKLTVSGVHRGEQRRIYDARREEVLPQHGIKLVVLRCDQFERSGAKRLKRTPDDARLIRAALEEAGVAIAAKNGERPEGIDEGKPEPGM